MIRYTSTRVHLVIWLLLERESILFSSHVFLFFFTTTLIVFFYSRSTGSNFRTAMFWKRNLVRLLLVLFTVGVTAAIPMFEVSAMNATVRPAMATTTTATTTTTTAAAAAAAAATSTLTSTSTSAITKKQQQQQHQHQHQQLKQGSCCRPASTPVSQRTRRNRCVPVSIIHPYVPSLSLVHFLAHSLSPLSLPLPLSLSLSLSPSLSFSFALSLSLSL